ncbi:MAG TPA: TonB-dependent receptor [Polyangiales bacterium]|nr:TonB-dependent receptor [Polyangiales bacterium]
MKLLLACGVFCVALSFNVRVLAQAPFTPASVDAGVDSGAAPSTVEGSADAGVTAPVEEGASADVPVLVEDEAAAAPELTISEESSVAAEPESRDEIVVTGSRIRRTKFSASAPVEVVDRAQIERTGATNLADVVQNLTTSQGNGSQGGLTQSGIAAQGTVTVNLRGLGEGATLLLINGRRVNPSGASVDTNVTDLSTIPLAAVERIEVLKAGASAIYGADAVGGVVNIITRKNFSGFRVEADGQATSRFDQKDFTGSAAFGASDERGRVMIAGSYLRRGELTAGERDWTKGSYISTQGQPGAYVPATAAGMPLAGAKPDPACANVPGSMPALSGTSELCSFGYRDFTTLIGNTERANVFGSAEYDLTKHTTVFGEISASRMRGDAINSPSLPLLPYPLIPANHVDNPFVVPAGLPNAGQRTPVLWIGRPLGAAAGGVRNPYADDTFRAVLGLKGDFEEVAEGTVFESWEWELYSMMGISRYRYTFKDNLGQPLLTALNSCSDPTNLTGCFNPFYSAIDGTGTPNTERVINSFSGEMTIMNDHALQTYNAGMSGSLFKLPGGDAALAFGGELRHEWRTGELDHDANEDRYVFYVGNPDSSVERNVYSGYLEVRWPFLDGLELQTAARVEHYTDIGTSAVSPFAGVTVTPAQLFGTDNTAPVFRRLQLRGNISTAFRAPTIVQSDSGFQTVPTPLRLTASSPLSTYLPVRRFGNSDLKPETALTISGGFSWAPIEQLSLLVDLWRYDYVDRIGVEDAQQIINEDMLTMDSRVVRDTNDSIVGVNVSQINVSGHTVTSGLDFGAVFDVPGPGRTPDSWNLSIGVTGTYTFVYDIPRGQTSTRAIPANPATGEPAKVLPPPDCDGNSAADFDMNTNNDKANDKDACHVAGKRNETNFAPPIPRWRVNFPVTFALAGHTLSAIPRFISGLDDDVQPNVDGTFDRISAWFSLDLQYGYTFKNVIGKELALRVGVYNVFDEDPPHVNGSALAYVNGIHDPRGRMIYAKLSGEF